MGFTGEWGRGCYLPGPGRDGRLTFSKYRVVIAPSGQIEELRLIRLKNMTFTACVLLCHLTEH